MKFGYFTLVAASAVLFVPVQAEAMTVNQMARRAHGNPFRCNHGSKSYTTAENKCVVRVVYRRERWIIPKAMRIVGCESSWNEWEVNSSSSASGLAQFLPSTWRNLPRFYSRHSVFNPVWNIRGMRYLWKHDGSFREWVCS